MKSLVNYISEEEAVQCVGKGWETLVRKVYNARTGLGIPVGIIQVKEKWGGLRIYTEYYVREIEDVIQTVCRDSLNVCETCGAPAGLVRRGAWYRTRCEEHRGEWVPVET